LLQIPEEGSECSLLVDLQGMPMTDALLPRSAFIHAVLDPVLNKLHCAVARRHERGVTRNRLHALRTRCLEKGPDSLSEKEISLLVKDKESLAWLHSEAWRANDDSVWGRLIHTI
jgi:membrane glycosyltransferase